VGRILLVSADVVGPSMAGPGIRAWEFARLLSREHEVTLAAPPPLGAQGDGFAVVEAVRSEIKRTAAAADAVIVQGSALDLFPSLAGLDRPLVVDLYDPYVLENLEIHARLPMPDRLTIADQDLAVLRQQIVLGDFFLCASERQRHLWLGALTALNRVNPLTYADDPTLQRLLAVVPFGLGDRPLTPGAPAIRGVLPGVGERDLVVLWGGGIWDWFDPLTLIEATARVAADDPRVKLVFMGTIHPNVSVPRPAMVNRALELAKTRGVLDRHVFFHQGWVPYEQRQSFLHEADVGASLHLHHLETLFSFRTRILDYLWAGLPLLVTAGDSMAELAEREGLGPVCPPQDVAAVEAGLRRLLDDVGYRQECAAASRRTAERFRWSVVAEPLLEFCRAPYRSPDAARRSIAAAPGLGARAGRRRLLLKKAWLSLRRDGPARFAARTLRYLRRRLA